MIYEIINMSDPYTIEAMSLDVAFVACVFLGSGQYAFNPIEEGGKEIPLFMFGGTEEWCKEHLSEELKSVVDRVTTDPVKSLELADCFDSCIVGRVEDRKAYLSGLQLIDDPAKREIWREQWLEDRRSSMNNIGARAMKMAKKLRAGNSNPLIGNRAPVQVFSK